MKRYKVVMVSAFSVRDMYTDKTYGECLYICREMRWHACPDGGFVWRLEIQRDYDAENRRNEAVYLEAEREGMAMY